jgi:hypothetical protein
MGNIDDIRAMSTNDRVRGIVGAVDVVKIVETFHGPCCPGKKGTGHWVLVSRLERLNQAGRFASPYERRHLLCYLTSEYT